MHTYLIVMADMEHVDMFCVSEATAEDAIRVFSLGEIAELTHREDGSFLWRNLTDPDDIVVFDSVEDLVVRHWRKYSNYFECTRIPNLKRGRCVKIGTITGWQSDTGGD